jgi:hypothetical protein
MQPISTQPQRLPGGPSTCSVTADTQQCLPWPEARDRCVRVPHLHCSFWRREKLFSLPWDFKISARPLTTSSVSRQQRMQQHRTRLGKQTRQSLIREPVYAPIMQKKTEPNPDRANCRLDSTRQNPLIDWRLMIDMVS